MCFYKCLVLQCSRLNVICKQTSLKKPCICFFLKKRVNKSPVLYRYSYVKVILRKHSLAILFFFQRIFLSNLLSCHLQLCCSTFTTRPQTKMTTKRIKVRSPTWLKFTLYLEWSHNHLPTPPTYWVTCNLWGWECDNFVFLRGSWCRGRLCALCWGAASTGFFTVWCLPVSIGFLTLPSRFLCFTTKTKEL